MADTILKFSLVAARRLVTHVPPILYTSLHLYLSYLSHPITRIPVWIIAVCASTLLLRFSLNSQLFQNKSIFGLLFDTQFLQAKLMFQQIVQLLLPL